MSTPLRATVQRTALPFLVLLSAGIIVLGKADQMVLDSVRVGVTDALAPALDVMSRPVAAVGTMIDRVHGVVSLYRENRLLSEENERLLQWQQSALKLSAENKQLRSLVKAVPEPAIRYTTARIIANSGGAYVRTVMIDAGSGDGLARGQAVISGDGLVGRLTEVGVRAARVLLITDLNSRVPVVVENSHAAAVLAGDNSDRPRLVYLGTSGEVRVGDRVVTSGEGGIFPPGVAVGVVAAIDGGVPRIEPYADLSQIGYLMAVDYGLSGGLPQPVPPVTPANRRRKGNVAEGAVR
ncbi:MAG TPA: rod shape-determining protein MreC [Stellaceae bacterium]|jgi:rod shape-determining protein MreC|nr:rod shape-determining protein MreC [Stellaceae bacterium]